MAERGVVNRVASCSFVYKPSIGLMWGEGVAWVSGVHRGVATTGDLEVLLGGKGQGLGDRERERVLPVHH